MTTITVSKDGTICFPNHLLQLMGWHAGSELEVMSTDEGVILKPITSESSLDSKTAKDKLTNQACGMIKVTSESDATLYKQELDEACGMIKAKAPQGFNLIDFNVGNHIKLFDEN